MKLSWEDALTWRAFAASRENTKMAVIASDLPFPRNTIGGRTASAKSRRSEAATRTLRNPFSIAPAQAVRQVVVPRCRVPAPVPRA